MTKQGWFSVLKGLCIGLTVVVILTLILNGIALKGKDPAKWMNIMAHAIRVAGAFGAAFSAVKLTGDNKMMTGVCTGTLSGLLWLIVGMLTGSNRFLLMILMVILFGAVGALGGLCGKSDKRSMRGRHKSMMKRMS